MRLDRTLTLCVAGPLSRLNRAKHPARLPILMYHSVSEEREPGLRPYYRLCTAPARFHEHIRWLATHGWRGVSVSEALEEYMRTGAWRADTVVITFDDGFRNFATDAFPILARYGFTATMYVATDYVAEPPRQFCGRDCLTWSDIRQLHATGIEFGSHTASHPVLASLPWPQIEDEITRSRRTLQEQLDAEIRTFAYPFAYPQANVAFIERFTELLAATGYESAVTTSIGTNLHTTDVYQLQRLPVNGDDDLALLAAKLHGEYDWTGVPQRLFKRFKRPEWPRGV